jgi:MFS family permease
VAASSLLIDLTPLRQSRDFRLLWLSQVATGFGRQVVVVAVPFQVYQLTHSSLAVGLLGIFQAVPIVIAGLYGGALADRYDRRWLQIGGKTVVGAGSAVLAVGAIGLRAPVWVVFAVVTVTAAASTLDQASRTATVARIVSPGLLPSAMSLSQALMQATLIVGPAVAGPIILRGLPLAYLADVVGFLPAVVMVGMLSPQGPMPGARVSVGFRAPLEALRYVRRSRLVVGLFSSDLVAMIFGMPVAIFPALALSVYGIGAAGLGLLYAAPGVGALAGSLLSGWVRRISHQGWAVFVAIAVWGLAIAGFGLAGPRLWLSLPLLAIAGAADLVSAIFRGTILQLNVPDAMRGRMSAFHLMVVTTGPRLGDLEAGAVAALVSPVFSVVSGGIACVAGIAVLATLLPEMRHYRGGSARGLANASEQTAG